MFVEEPREPDFTRLGFVRRLCERGLLEHEVFGPPSGPFVEVRAVQQMAELPLASRVWRGPFSARPTPCSC